MKKLQHKLAFWTFQLINLKKLRNVWAKFSMDFFVKEKFLLSMVKVIVLHIMPKFPLKKLLLLLYLLFTCNDKGKIFEQNPIKTQLKTLPLWKVVWSDLCFVKVSRPFRKFKPCFGTMDVCKRTFFWHPTK